MNTCPMCLSSDALGDGDGEGYATCKVCLTSIDLYGCEWNHNHSQQ